MGIDSIKGVSKCRSAIEIIQSFLLLEDYTLILFQGNMLII